VENHPVADDANLKELTADIVASYVSNNPVPVAEVANLVMAVHAALAEPSTAATADAEPVKKTPAVPIRKSVTPDGITCLFDGETFKTLRRHLLAAHGMTPAEYRQAWNLPPDYPMVSETTSRMRSELAKSIGLGAKAKGMTPAGKAAAGLGAKTGKTNRSGARKRP
jgi:predicted transcriptional regulator